MVDRDLAGFVYTLLELKAPTICSMLTDDSAIHVDLRSADGEASAIAGHDDARLRPIHIVSRERAHACFGLYLPQLALRADLLTPVPAEDHVSCWVIVYGTPDRQTLFRMIFSPPTRCGVA